MIGMMNGKGGANSVAPQMGGLASAFANNAPAQPQPMQQIAAPTLGLPQAAPNTGGLPGKGGDMPAYPTQTPAWSSPVSPAQAAAATASRIQTRTPVLPVDPVAAPAEKPERVSRHFR